MNQTACTVSVYPVVYPEEISHIHNTRPSLVKTGRNYPSNPTQSVSFHPTQQQYLASFIRGRGVHPCSVATVNVFS